MVSKDFQGLTSEQAAESRRLHGVNVITPAAEDSAWRLFADKFRDPLIRVLLVAALLSFGIAVVERDFLEPVGILCALVLATCVGFVFEWDAMRRFRRLNRVNDEQPVKVLRDGAVCEIPRREVVVGDAVFVESGEMVPADGELVEAVSLAVDESTLTGEPQVEKTTRPECFDPEATYPSNAVLRGTTVADGYGRFVVTAVGDATEAGRVTEQATVRHDAPTPLQCQLARLSRYIGWLGIVLSVGIFVLLLLKSFFTGALLAGGWLHALQQVLHIFMVSVALIVMAVPEGLPMSITLSLAMSMRRMLRTNNLVRRMHACETMGAVTVICTDKTGTLTQNRMHVGEMLRDEGVPLHEFAEAIAVNTTAFLDAEGKHVGNPTEGALLEWLGAQGEDYAALRRGAQIVDRMTFTTERKYMATVVRSGITGRRLICVKGAPEIVRSMCAEAWPDETAARLAEYQSRAMRTLGIAWGVAEAEDCATCIAAGGLRYAGIAALSDPLREEVPDAVAAACRAGIAIKLVTGDTQGTALEIARRIGLWDDAADGPDNRMTGPEFAATDDERLAERVSGLKILSRARPLDKQRLVRLLQERGEVVAVTGDGTNDAPALHFAQVGLSMGSGTSVAKDASDITLIDDSFASIVTAVLWGRSLYRNIQRFVLFQLTINFAAIVVCLVGAVLGHDLPLTVVQILWVNIIMDTFAAMAMSSLPPDPAVLADPPRSGDEFIITPAMARTLLVCGGVITAVLLAMLFAWEVGTGGMTPVEQTLFFSVFVFLQFWNMFNAKGFETRSSVFAQWRGCREFLLILLAIGVGQGVIVENGGGVFRTVPLTFAQWAWVIGGTSLLAFGGEVVRALRRRRAAVVRNR